MCVCGGTCVVYKHMSEWVQVLMCKKARGKCWVFSSPYSFKAGSPTDHGARLVASGPSDPPVPAICPLHYSTRVTDVHSHAQLSIWVLEFELRSSCLHGKCSYTINHLPSPGSSQARIGAYNYKIMQGKQKSTYKVG